MAKNINTKKISVAAFDKIMRNSCSTVETIEWNGVEITLRKTLPLKDVISFVNLVAKSCFDYATNAYLPEVKVFAIKCCILEMYANFSLPSNTEHKYNLIYNTDAVDTVIKHINTRQLDEIIDAINEKVDSTAQANIEAVHKQMNDIYHAFDNLQKQVEQIFANVNSEDMSSFIQAVANDKIDEDKLVQAYVKQTTISEDK